MKKRNEKTGRTSKNEGEASCSVKRGEAANSVSVFREQREKEETSRDVSVVSRGSRRGEGICVSVGRRDLIRACRVSLRIVGNCLLSQEMAYARIGALANERVPRTLSVHWISVLIFWPLLEQSLQTEFSSRAWLKRNCSNFRFKRRDWDIKISAERDKESVKVIRSVTEFVAACHVVERNYLLKSVTIEWGSLCWGLNSLYNLSSYNSNLSIFLVTYYFSFT